MTDDWRQTHLGRLLGHAMRRFDARVLDLMAHNVEVPLTLSNLAAEMREPPAVVVKRHRSQIVRQTDQKTCLPEATWVVKVLSMHPACA